MLDEPVFAGQKSGLELRSRTRARSRSRASRRPSRPRSPSAARRATLEISPIFGEPGAYRSVFFPTAAGPYTFRIFGEVEGEPFDETFTAGPDTFGEVQDAAGGQFPVQYPPTGDVVSDAEAGAAAGTTATIALVLGAAGLLAGVAALGLSLARRRS